MVPVDRSILLDYYLTQFAIRALLKSLPDSTRRDRLGEEEYREIAITLIVKAPGTCFQVQTFWTAYTAEAALA